MQGWDEPERAIRSDLLEWFNALDPPKHPGPAGGRVNAVSLKEEFGEAEAEPIDAATALVLGGLAESDFDFFQRRALEEAHSARRATCPRAAASHRYLASVYSEKVRREMEANAHFEELLRRLA